MKRKRITVQLTSMEMECLKLVVNDPVGTACELSGILREAFQARATTEAKLPDASSIATIATAREALEKIAAAWKDAPEYKKRTVHA